MQEVVLKVENVYKSYGQKEVLKGVSFDVKKGETVAFVGVNGSGKSTLIEIICGVKSKNSGIVSGIVNNCKNFGYMPQTFSLFADLSVYDNLDYFSILYNVPKNRINEVLKECFLEDKKYLLCSQLSGGYKQLTALAVAILHSPPFLILDEPTSAMDPIFRDKFWQIIEKYAKKGNSILIITHYMEEIQKCKKLMALSNGKIIYNNSVEETFAKGDIKSVAEVLYKFSEVSCE